MQEISMVMSAFVMGVVGGPHCVAMCGAACAGIGRMAAPQSMRALLLFQFGRLLGYAVLGAVVAGSVQAFAWMGSNTAVLRPLWTALHVSALLLGAWLLIQGRQPYWIDGLGQQIWRRVKSKLQTPGGRAPAALGFAWAFMPCGLLYSALLAASLSGTVWGGALTMASFAAGSGLLLAAGPWLLLRLGQMGGKADWGIRLGGLMLTLTSAWAIWNGLTNPTGLWCA